MPRVHHMVLLKFKAATAEDIPDRFFASLLDLKRIMPKMAYFSGGPYSSPEGLHQGYTHGFLMTFNDAAARDHYLTHPEHEKVKDAVLPFIDSVVAFDFEETAQ